MTKLLNNNLIQKEPWLNTDNTKTSLNMKLKRDENETWFDYNVISSLNRNATKQDTWLNTWVQMYFKMWLEMWLDPNVTKVKPDKNKVNQTAPKLKCG